MWRKIRHNFLIGKTFALIFAQKKAKIFAKIQAIPVDKTVDKPKSMGKKANKRVLISAAITP